MVRRILRLSACAAVVLAAPTASAIETGAPPQLPPPPPPPLSQGQPPPPPGRSQPPPSSAPTRVRSSPSSSTSSSSSYSSSDDGPSGDSALDTRWALAGMLGVSTDYLNFGLGVRGGKTWDNHLYIGASALYHFASGGYYYAGPLGVGSSSASVFYFGPEGGYDFDLHAVVLRAYMGLGPAFFSWSTNTPGGNYGGSDTRFVIWPGASVIWSPPGSPWFVGGDIRFVSVPGGPAVGFFAFGGIHLGD